MKSTERWELETLKKITAESKTVNEVLIKLGLIAGGHNNKTFKKYKELYNIDTTHFIKRYAKLVKFNVDRKIKTENILVRNSEYSRTNLKRRLYSEGLKERECEMCGQEEIWNGKKMSLILDHANGIRNDNRLENLRILCPNCNSTLDTHCGKNKSNHVKSIKILNYDELKNELNISTRFEIFKRYGETYRNKRMLNDLDKLENLKKSDINFTKFGWVTKAAKILKIKDPVVNRWIKRVDPEFYKSCFVRKQIN